tara:strand:+ start:168 stop:491 length:324 start_codon:yes stop_codon:yes gene_type:complete
MLTLTDISIKKIEDMASKDGLNDASIRLAVIGGGCSGFSYDIDFEDTQREGDQVIDTGKFKVYVDPMSYMYVHSTTVDYVESFNFTGFHFDNPSAKRTCGCGSSFGV